MNWRWVPPVASPISLRSLVVGAGAATGVLPARRESLERHIAVAFSGDAVALTDSGTSALIIALRAALPKGGVVAYPAYACIDIIAAAIHARVGVRIYDVDPQTLSPDLDSLRAALARGAAAVLVAPLYGYPVDHQAVASIAREHGVAVIEDAAQGAAGTLHGKRIGSFGDVTVLSFGRGKGTTGGSGGAVIARGAAWVARMNEAASTRRRAQRGVRDVIALGVQWAAGRPGVYGVPASIPALALGEMVYHEAGEPRMISAAAARVVPRAFAADPAAVSSRRARAGRLIAAASRGNQFSAVRAVEGGEPGYLRLPVVDATGSATAAPRLGALRGYPVTLDEHQETRRVLVAGEAANAGARTLRDRLFTVPTHALMSAGDERRLAGWLSAVARGGDGT